MSTCDDWSVGMRLGVVTQTSLTRFGRAERDRREATRDRDVVAAVVAREVVVAERREVALHADHPLVP